LCNFSNLDVTLVTLCNFSNLDGEENEKYYDKKCDWACTWMVVKQASKERKSPRDCTR